MKPHLPLSLRRALLKSLSGGLHKTLCSGSLMLAGIFLWNGGLAEATASESGDSAATVITLNGEVLQDEAGATRARLSTERLGSEEEQAEAEREAEAAGADEEAVVQEETTTGQQEAELTSTGKDEEEKSADRLSFTTRLMLAMEKFLSEKTVWSKGGGIEPWDPDIAYCHYRPRTIYVYLPQTRFLLIGDTYENCYGPWPPRKNDTTEDKNNAADKDSIAEKSDKESATSVLSTVATDTALTEDSDTSSQRTLPEATSSSDADTGSNNPSARFAAESMAMMRYSRSMLAAAASYSTSALSASDDEVATIAVDGLIWQGGLGGYWDESSRYWSENGTTTTFSGGDSVSFAESNYKNINVTGARTAENITITGAGYSFSGSNITATGVFDIRSTGNTTFSASNNISAGTLNLASEIDTTTTFNGTVTATTLNLANGTRNSEYAGSYEFNGAVNVSGTASVNLGLAGTGANHKLLLKANNSFSAGTLSLAGAAMKSFDGSVTTTGDLIIAGSSSNGDTADAHDGATTFTGSVNVGGDFILRDNGAATFGNNSSLNVTGDIYMGDASLTYTRFTQGAKDALGTIYLTADGAQVNIESLTRVSATISSEGSTAYNFTIGSTPREFDATLNNISDLYVKGGEEVTIMNSTGQLKGSLFVSGGANVMLECDELFASTAPGNITVQNGTLNLGSTTQSFNGNIALEHGVITGSEGSAFNAMGNAGLSYTGTGNMVKGTLGLGANEFTATAVPTAGATTAADTTLTLTGDITGSGLLIFEGKGFTSIESDLSYTGQVHVHDGHVLDLSSNAALAQAGKVTVETGGTLSVTHGGSTTVVGRENAGVWNNDVQMDVGLEFANGATITFTDLNGHGDTPAIALKEGLLFNGNITFNFIESDLSKKLENLETYELITSETGINHATGSGGGVTVIANGKNTPLDSSQYSFGFYIDDQNLRHFTLTMLAGKIWKGGANGDWHAMTNGDYDNWTEGAVGEVAILRDMGTDIPSVRIELSKQSAAAGLYMDGATDYTIFADETFTNSFAAGAEQTAFKTPLKLVKKGAGDMTWEALPLSPAT